ncbi:MAG: hypothetical protein AB8I69_02270 [Anaerolineae bacterium]|jgi:hypothetical protein
MKYITLILILAALLILAGGVLAMESTDYKLAWFLPLNGSGGKSSSTSYVTNFTVGQSAVGAASSTNYGGCLGYWCGIEIDYAIYLPLVLRASP